MLISGLLGSKIFSFKFDFDEWPSTHDDPTEYVRGYNDSIFNLRYSYTDVFNEHNLQD